MKQTAFSILLILILYSCTNSSEIQEANQLNEPKNSSVESEIHVAEEALWADEFIKKYLEGNKDRLTEIDGYPVTYIKETIERNKRNYARVKIGHSFEHRYVTDQWIFIDSLSKEIFEYDVANDSLIHWNGVLKDQYEKMRDE